MRCPMKTYDIPNLARVTVASSTPQLVREAIAFQIGHFTMEAPRSEPELPLIRIAGYGGFAGPTPVEFHDGTGSIGSCWHHSAQRHATVRTESGFDVFTDTGEILVVLLLQILALRQGRSFLHAAGWVDAAGRATLVPGPGGVGKTALLTTAVREHGVRLLGDDLVLVDRTRQVAAFPRAFVLKPYHRDQFPDQFAAIAMTEERARRWRPLVRWVRENAPFHGMLKGVAQRAGKLDDVSWWLQRKSTAPDLHTVPVAELFGHEKVASTGTVHRVAYLERHRSTNISCDVLPTDVLVRRCLAVLHHEWADYLRWHASLGALDIVDWSEHFAASTRVLHEAFASTTAVNLKVPADTSPERLAEIFSTEVGFA